MSPPRNGAIPFSPGLVFNPVWTLLFLSIPGPYNYFNPFIQNLCVGFLVQVSLSQTRPFGAPLDSGAGKSPGSTTFSSSLLLSSLELSDTQVYEP